MTALLYALAGLGLALYAIFDGFDLGAGVVHFFVGRSERDRGAVISAIGPFWDGNEVWLLASGGVLFSAFPRVLGVAFSGFYLALFLIVWALVVRGMAIELRHAIASPLWRSLCDAAFAASSIALALLFGVALGNVLRGVPTRAGWFTLPLFGGLGGSSEAAIIDGYTLGVGVFSVLALGHHGALFLAWRSTGEVRARARRAASLLFVPVLVAAAALVLLTGRRLHLWPGVRALPLAATALSALIATRAWGRRDGLADERAAFVASCAFIGAALGGVGATLYPTLLRSSDGGADLTADAAVVGAYGARAMVGWVPFALMLVAVYFANLFRIHRSKAEVEEHD
jgi:cytochrome d ubiquinol oxidase subunit II